MSNPTYRINGFDQIKALYSIVFEQKYSFKPHHISLYVFLINQNNRNNWVEWFKCPFDLVMAGACIGSKKTYYKCLSELKEWGLLDYEKGSNEWKAAKIKLKVLKCTTTVPLSEPQGVPQDVPQGVPQSGKRYKPITNNLKQETVYRSFASLVLFNFEFENILQKGYTKNEIDSMLDSIENYKGNKKYTSLNLTLKKWLRKEYGDRSLVESSSKYDNIKL